ncbi:hypothetical protein RFI_25768 [Reticulomyxa filosa]|uniref:Uncharacterized protein n=1 Tax=Reticulomyxa filosa TaxID=46433 RepID=X6MEX7_RETFI|nr:hypothetical protein RFI_25768 [Reticulomyxa filosa]|eukprot:ETO11610.1 hypothetical protein RFI_25768 [Reticulomyxa filosa]
MVGKPFGQVRLNCLELLTISADFAQFKCGKVLGNLKFDFWKAILELAFTHKANNLFLCHFRRLVHLSMIFKRRFLKYLFVDCVMLDRFIDFYHNELPRCTLHSYILQMLWDIYHHDQREAEPATNETKDKKDETNEEDSQSDNGSVVINENENDEENQDEDKAKKKTKEKMKTIKVTHLDKMKIFTDPEDQWGIVKFFDAHPKWSNFSKVLTQQIEIQMSSEQLPFQQGNNGEGMSQLDALLSHFTEDGADENEQQPEGGDSSDSDVCTFFFVSFGHTYIKLIPFVCVVNG